MRESTWRGSFPRLAPLKVTLKKIIGRYGHGKWVYQISGLYSFSVGQEVGQQNYPPTNAQIYLRVNLGITTASVFWFFEKNDLQGRQPRKTAASRGFSAYFLFLYRFSFGQEFL